MVIPFKVFGLQRSCTNLTRTITCLNFQVTPTEKIGEWKHGKIGVSASRIVNNKVVRLLLCVRNPYAWLLSCYQYFYRAFGVDSTMCPHFKQNMKFRRFVTSKHYTWNNPIERWNELNKHWIDYIDNHPKVGFIVFSERMMTQSGQISVLEEMEKHFDFKRKKPELQSIVQRVGTKGQLLSERMNFKYFNDKKYETAFDKKLLSFINDRLDKELIDRLEYEFIHDC